MFEWINNFPAGTWGAVLLVVLVVAAFVGTLLRRRHVFGQETRDETEQGYIVSGMVTLLAFMLGFTFALALDRFESRRQLVGEDARAIQELYLRAQMLDEPHRTRMSTHIAQYTDNRLQLATMLAKDAVPADAEHRRLVRELWRDTIAAFQTIRGIDYSSAFVDSANKVIELDAARVSARAARIPGEVFFVLFVYATITTLVLGFVLRNTRTRLSGALLILLYVMAIVLLVDLNQPVTGLVRESQLPMERLNSWIRANPPAAFDSGPRPAATADQ